jgi:hypothetical protein
MAICVEHYILWQYFLDIQAWLSYTHFQRKQVLIKKESKFLSKNEASKKILVAGDHILFDITPNIAYWPEMEDTLGEYLASLEKVKALDVELVLTGHRRLVHDLHRRIRELQEHHRARLQEVLVALGDGEKDILQIAPHISWDITAKTWEEFPPPQKWFAFGEIMAHVKYLEARGKVRCRSRNGIIKYALA